VCRGRTFKSSFLPFRKESRLAAGLGRYGSHDRKQYTHVSSAANDGSTGHSSGSDASRTRSGEPKASSKRAVDVVVESNDTTARASRLETALLLRRLYRNLLRSSPLLELPSPVYQPPDIVNQPELDPDTANSMDIAAADAAADAQLQARVEEAVILVAEMELTAEELRMGLRALKAAPFPLDSLFDTGVNKDSQSRIEERVRDVYAQLIARVSTEVPLLPFPSLKAAQAALDLRNARYRATMLPSLSAASSNGDVSSSSYVAGSMSDGEGAPEGAFSVYIAPDTTRRRLTMRLEEAERVAERFVSRRLQPAVARVKVSSPQGVIRSLQSGAVWARGLWERLNGAGREGALGGVGAPEGLPLPSLQESERDAAIDALHKEIEELERKLQEASKARETRLRKAGIQGRARLAAELRQMDNEVVALSRALAVRTLQLEMEFIHGCLEAEAMDILGDPSVNGPDAGLANTKIALALSRRGSTDEIALLVAEFKQLDTELADLATEVEAGSSLFIEDAELAALATEVPDLRLRLGVNDSEVFGGSGFTFVKLQMQTKQNAFKVVEAINFGVRGVKLLGADIGAAAGLFWRALLGGTLKPREVAALRRTARDLLTFIPFAVILILPLTPIGHVLIFGFIQRYFPGFFPSQFTSRRQDLMVKYEELKRQLRQAQMAAEAESDEMNFRRAAEELRRKTNLQATFINKENDDDGNTDVIDHVQSNATDESALDGVHSPATQPVEFGANGAGASGVGGNVVDVNDDEEESEGPAAAVVRKLEQELAAAADSSYTDMDSED
jgi:hypothetical protein